MKYILGVLVRTGTIILLLVLPLMVAPYTRDGSYISGFIGLFIGLTAIIALIAILAFILLIIFVPGTFTRIMAKDL